MYEKFFGFTESPFAMTPDTRYLFYSNHHREAFASLRYGIEEKKGFIVITGEVGTGKTTTCRALLNQLDPSINVALIFNPMLNEKELLQAVIDDLEINRTGTTLKELVDILNEYLLEQTAQGKNTVIIIDEAQDLSPRVLEQIRLLSNLETEREKLLQIVLVGQPELMYILRKEELRQLRQRITVSYHLKPLNRDELKRYILHRLEVAGNASGVTFTDAAIRVIYKYTAGIPRMINSLCDKVLLGAYVQETHEITPSLVKSSIRDLEGYRFPYLQKIVLPALGRVGKYVTIGAGLGLALFVLMWFAVNRDAVFDKMRTPDPVVSLPPAKDAQSSAEAPAVTTVEMIGFPEDVDEIGAFTSFLAHQGAATVFVPREPVSGRTAVLAQVLRRNGYESYFYSGNLFILKTIGLPVFIKVKLESGLFYLPIIEFNADGARVLVGPGREVSLEYPEIDRVFRGRAVVVFKPGKNYISPPLQRGVDSPRTVDLREGLRRVGYVSGGKGTVFDNELEDRLKEFQEDHALVPDGIYGEKTALVLYRVLDERGGTGTAK